MGNSQGQLKSSKFETALHMSIEQALRSNSTTPHPLFSQLYLEKDIKVNIPDLLPHTSDSSGAEALKSPTPKGKGDKENEPLRPQGVENVPPCSMPAARLGPSLPPVPAPIPMVHAPPSLQGVMLSPRLPPSPLGPNYIHQRFLLPGQYPPHALPPLLHQVPPPSRQVDRRPTISPGRPGHPGQASLPVSRDDSVLETMRRSEVEPPGYMLQPMILGGCQEVGFCQAGADIRLTEISDKSLEVPAGFTLVGAKSPYLPENILVAAVDMRFLPDPTNSQALLGDTAGFSGNCVGCGEKGFRYFTEFAHHINLKLISQAKKQKHLKYYIIANKQGHWINGPLIPWKECKKSMNEDGDSPDEMEEKDAEEESSSSNRHSLTPPPKAVTTIEADLPSQSESAPSTRVNSPKTMTDGDGKEKSTMVSSSSKLTTRDLKQPLKKRHRFHSVDEDALRKTKESPVVPAKRRAPPSVFPLPRFLPPPLTNAQDCTFVPHNLAQACGTKVVILDCSGAVPVFHGNIVDVFVSPLFRESMRPLLQVPTSVAKILNVQSNQALNFEANILLLMKYFLQLGSRIPSREEFDLTLLRARQDTKNTTGDAQALSVVAPAQLPFLAKLCISASNGTATFLLAENSLARGLSEALKFLATLPPANKRPQYIFIINVSRQRGTEFCVVVPGPHQARALIEASLSTSETLKENSIQVITGKVHLLTSHFAKNSFGFDMDTLLSEFDASLQGRVFTPFNGNYQEKIEEAAAIEMKSASLRDLKGGSFQLHPNQIQTAMKILSQVCAIADLDHRSLDLGRFFQVGLLIIVPPSEVLYEQTVERLYMSNLLLDLGLVSTNSREGCRQFVMKADNSKDSHAKFEHFIVSVECMPQTLFVLVQDQAHLDIFRFPQVQQYQQGGLSSQMINSKSILNAPNVLCLQVSSLPYSLQTKKTRVAKENEIFMDTLQYQDLQDPTVTTKYFGISDYQETMSWSNHAPLLQVDETYEQMAAAMLARYPGLHSMLIRTFLLVRQYSAALMNAVGISELHDDTTTATSILIQDLINAPLKNEQGQGGMVLFRIISPQLAAMAHERLREVRNKLGLQFRFDVLLCGMDLKFELDKHFLERLQSWRECERSWIPQTLKDLEGLPCIVIMTNKDTTGESMPKSLKVIDLRLVNHGVFDLASLEQELGLGCTYVNKSTLTQVVTVHEESCDEDDVSEEEGQDPRVEDVQMRTSEDGFQNAAITEQQTEPKSTPVSITVTPPAPVPSLDHNHEDRDTKGVAVPPVNMMVTPPSSEDGKFKTTLKSNSLDSPVSAAKDKRIAREEGRIEGAVASRKWPPLFLLSKSAFSAIKEAEKKPYPPAATLLPSRDTTWNSPLRPLLTSDNIKDKSSYFREWTDPKTHHFDFELSGAKDQYHPRRLLLCGPPQVGKTGSYLHFCRVLYRMLIKLQEVEVCDDDDEVPASNTLGLADLEVGQRWPDVTKLSNMKFDQTILQGKYKLCSPMWSQALQNDDLMKRASSGSQADKSSTVLLHLAKFSAHNAFHHCEECQSYRESSNNQLRQTRVHSVKISDPQFGELDWQFLIPPQQETHFVFDPETGHLGSICLALIDEQRKQTVKSPIFTIVRNSAQQSLVNLHHAMEGFKHLHILVCKEKDAVAVQKQWPCHVVVVLPHLANDMGQGGVKYLVKQIAEYNMLAEMQRQKGLGVDPDKVWPFVLLMEDSLVSWKEIVPEDEECSEVMVSLKTVVEHIESIKNVTQYALLGISQWNSRSKVTMAKCTYHRSLVNNLIFLNLQLTKSVQYDPYKYQHEDVDFCLRVNAKNLLICKLCYFLVMVKTSLSKRDQLETSVHPSVVKQSSLPSMDPTAATNFMISPDSESPTLLQAPSHFLLERYLSEVACDCVLSSEIDLIKHPVMLVNGYFNLGPKIPVYIISSSDESAKETKEMIFGGIVLNTCMNQAPEADFIKQFHFVKGARLLLISPDRNSLRRYVAELDLERKWHFRLRDELQTANVPEDKPVSLLMGIYGMEKDTEKEER